MSVSRDFWALFELFLVKKKKKTWPLIYKTIFDCKVGNARVRVVNNYADTDLEIEKFAQAKVLLTK